ncbi:MAG: hypothetical protein ABIP00_02780 [Pyrinomonadaceae bacterium]
MDPGCNRQNWHSASLSVSTPITTARPDTDKTTRASLHLAPKLTPTRIRHHHRRLRLLCGEDDASEDLLNCMV